MHERVLLNVHDVDKIARNYKSCPPMHERVPTNLYDNEVVDVYFGNPNQCCDGGPVDGGAQASALRLARSGGMVRNRRADQTPYYLTAEQFLYSRNYLHASSSGMHCPGALAGSGPVASTRFYHPNNTQYGVQAAVTAAERAWRLRYNATVAAGPPIDTPYGVMQPNALAFVNGARLFDLKDRIGPPYPCHPQVTHTGELQCLPLYYPSLAFGP